MSGALRDLIHLESICGDQVVIEYADDHWTYKRLMNEARRAGMFIRSRFGTKKNIAIHFNNEPEYICALLGTWMAGCVAVPIPSQARKSEIDKIVSCCDVAGYLRSPKIPETLKPECTCYGYDEINEAIGPDRQIELDLDHHEDGALILSTSGSTGNPKHVLLSHDNVYSNAIAHGNAVMYAPHDRFLITMPVFFSSTITTQIISCLLFRTVMVLTPLPIVPKYGLWLIREKRVTGFACVPAFLAQLVKEHARLKSSPGDYAHVKFIVVSGAALHESLAHQVYACFPQCDVIQTYGLSEASPRVSLMRRGSRRLTCGRPVANVELMIADASGNKLDEYQVGEVLVRGPNVMKGYYKNEELTRKTIVNGWLKTGDLGYLDAQGELHITGRIKNIINVGGIVVYPEEIEELLLNMEEIEEAVVVGQEDSDLGEVPVCIVKPTHNTNIDLEKIQSRLRSALAPYKMPRKWRVAEEPFPKTSTGKIDRKMVSAMWVDEGVIP